MSDSQALQFLESGTPSPQPEAVREVAPTNAPESQPQQQQIPVSRQGTDIPDVPGARLLGQPAGNAPAAEAQASPVTQQVPDFAAQIAQERALRQQAEAQAAQGQHMMQQIQQYAQQKKVDETFDRDMQAAVARTATMPSDEAERYILGESKRLLNAQRAAAAYERTQMEYVQQQRVMDLVKPQYVDYLIKATGLPDSYRPVLESYGTTEAMHQAAPALQQQYNALQAQFTELKQGQQQLARAQEVGQIRSQGFGQAGGQLGANEYQFEVSDDPDEKAMQILALQDMVNSGRVPR